MKINKKQSLARIINLPLIKDEGYLCFLEAKKHVPFLIKRIYYIFNVEKNAVRGRHTHKKTQQVIFCLEGRITIILDNGKRKEAITLNKPNQGLFLDAMIWHEMVAFKTNTILLIVASEPYQENDYIRNYENYLRKVKHDSNE